MVKVKLKKKLTGGLFGPSSISEKKSPPKVSAKVKPKASTKKAKPDKVIHPALANAKPNTAKGGALKRKIKPDPVRDAAIAKAFEQYMHKMHLPAWGNTKLDADEKGFDGHADLKLEKFLVNQLKMTKEKIISKALLGDEKVISTIIQCATYNAWAWSNFAHRIWSNTLNEQPPIRRVVAINLSDLIPCVNHVQVLDHIIAALCKDKELKQAFQSLGLCKTKVRLLPLLQTSAKPATMYKLYDLLTWQKGNSYSMRGLVINADVQAIEDLPRDICIIQLSDLRKSALSQLNTAMQTGHKVIMPFAVLKGDLKSLKDIKSSKTYQQLTKTWSGLTPLISMPNNSKMEIIGKVSKLGDILLA